MQVTFFDLRFSVDSVYERFCKVLQFTTMGVFAARSTGWDPFTLSDRNGDDYEDSAKAFRTVSIALVCSRAVLALQYSVAARYAWKDQDKTIKAKPIVIHAAIMFVSALVYTSVSNFCPIGACGNYHIPAHTRAGIPRFHFQTRTKPELVHLVSLIYHHNP